MLTAFKKKKGTRVQHIQPFHIVFVVLFFLPLCHGQDNSKFSERDSHQSIFKADVDGDGQDDVFTFKTVDEGWRYACSLNIESALGKILWHSEWKTTLEDMNDYIESRGRKDWKGYVDSFFERSYPRTAKGYRKTKIKRSQLDQEVMVHAMNKSGIGIEKIIDDILSQPQNQVFVYTADSYDSHVLVYVPKINQFFECASQLEEQDSENPYVRIDFANVEASKVAEELIISGIEIGPEGGSYIPRLEAALNELALKIISLGENDLQFSRAFANKIKKEMNLLQEWWGPPEERMWKIEKESDWLQFTKIRTETKGEILLIQIFKEWSGGDYGTFMKFVLQKNNNRWTEIVNEESPAGWVDPFMDFDGDGVPEIIEWVGASGVLKRIFPRFEPLLGFTPEIG